MSIPLLSVVVFYCNLPGDKCHLNKPDKPGLEQLQVLVQVLQLALRNIELSVVPCLGSRTGDRGVRNGL